MGLSLASVWPYGSSSSVVVYGAALALASMTSQAWASPSFGVDISYPVHTLNVSTNYAWLPHNAHPEAFKTPEKYKTMPYQPIGDRRTFYENMMERCRAYGGDENNCYADEADRVEGNVEQPSICYNFTDTMYKKIRVPNRVMELLTDFWKQNFMEEAEEVDVGTLINMWDTKASMVSLLDDLLLKNAVCDNSREVIEHWTGNKLKPSSLYGIRVYREGHVLGPHVDRLPLISSAIINVAQDTDEPWPLEVYDRKGNAVNITMEPGDMVLYESHALLHGRPYALEGRFFANIFVHFEPREVPKGSELPTYLKSNVDDEYLQTYYYDELEDHYSAWVGAASWLGALRDLL